MRVPARFVSGQLVWSTSGTVWAVWRVAPTTYEWLGNRAKLDLHARTRAALLALPGESLLLSLCERIDPVDVVQRMVTGVDLDATPEWAEAATVTLDGLVEVDLWRRAHFICACLPATGSTAARAVWGSARAAVTGSFGLASGPPAAAEIAVRRRQADAVGSALRNSLGSSLRAASADEIAWVYARASRRGIDDLALPSSGRPGGDRDHLGPAALVGLGEAVFAEGGEKTDDRPGRSRRYLKVTTEAGVAYQTFLAVAEMPHRFSFPAGGGAEWLKQADKAAFPVDWACRVRPVPNADAQVKARRKARALIGQIEEYEGEPTGAPSALAEAIEGVEDQRAALAANPSDPELETTMVMCVWAENLHDLEERAEALRASYEGTEFQLPRPTGGQLGFYGMMLPGAPMPPVARDYTQHLLPRDLAAGMPFAGADVGDPRGMLLGVSIDGGTDRPVLFDPAYGPSINTSGSMGVVGDLGAGKSHATKCLTWATVARGGQVIALDRTPMGEWAAFASVCPGRPKVVRLAAGSDVSLDPLAVFDGEDRARVAIGLLSLLTGAGALDLEGAELSRAVRAVCARPGGRLVDVIDELETRGESDTSAETVARKLRALSAEGLAQLVFGDAPPLRLGDADFIVFHTPELSLPDREVLVHEHLAKRLLPDQVLSQALLYLVTACARKVAFADRSRFSAVLIDEAWALTSSLEGAQLIFETVKDGRKHNAAMWLVSQHPDDLGEERIRDLLRNRLVFRQARASARRSLEFLGIDATEEAVASLEGAETGQCLFRDVRGRTGLVQILDAPTAELAAAFNTTPDSPKAPTPAPPPREAAA